MKKRAGVKQDIISFCGWEFLEELIEKANRTLYKVLIATLFETGGRVSEVLMLQKSNFDLQAHPDIILVRNMPVEKSYKIIGRQGNKYITEKVKFYRSFPIPKKEPLAHYILDYLDYIDWNEKLFDYTRIRVYQIVKEIGKRLNKPVPNANIHSSQLYPHAFRAERASQLVEGYRFSVFDLNRFFGWKNRQETMAEHYARTDWKHLAQLMGIV